MPRGPHAIARCCVERAYTTRPCCAAIAKRAYMCVHRGLAIRSLSNPTGGDREGFLYGPQTRSEPDRSKTV